MDWKKCHFFKDSNLFMIDHSPIHIELNPKWIAGAVAAGGRNVSPEGHFLSKAPPPTMGAILLVEIGAALCWALEPDLGFRVSTTSPTPWACSCPSLNGLTEFQCCWSAGWLYCPHWGQVLIGTGQAWEMPGVMNIINGTFMTLLYSGKLIPLKMWAYGLGMVQ